MYAGIFREYHTNIHDFTRLLIPQMRPRKLKSSRQSSTDKSASRSKSFVVTQANDQ